MTAGATPNETISASESSSRPSAEASLRIRAMRPSITSHSNATGSKSAPTQNEAAWPSVQKRRKASTAAIPATPLRSVRKSAARKARSIEK
jgi:hypothetical protein